MRGMISCKITSNSYGEGVLLAKEGGPEESSPEQSERITSESDTKYILQASLRGEDKHTDFMACPGVRAPVDSAQSPTFSIKEVSTFKISLVPLIKQS